MNTHIIIPIEDIEAEIKKLNLELDLSGVHNEESYGFIRGRIRALEQLLHNSKQISLNEEDIENKQHGDIAVACNDLWTKYYNQEERRSLAASCALDGMVKGYKQALLDLKKTL